MAEIRLRTKKPVGELRPGDSIELSVTAQIVIDGDNNYVKFAATSFVADGENGDDAFGRTQMYVMEKFERAVESTLTKIRSMS